MKSMNDFEREIELEIENKQRWDPVLIILQIFRAVIYSWKVVLIIFSICGDILIAGTFVITGWFIFLWYKITTREP